MSSIRARGGKLVFDFIYRGQRCRETTKLLDCPKDKKIAEEILSRIEAEILLEQFEYAKYFPKSKKLLAFQSKPNASPNNSMTYEEFYRLWFAENSGPWRPATITTIEGFMRKYILPAFGAMPLNQITKSDLLLFRNGLINTVGRGNKKIGSNHINKIMMKCKVVLAEASIRFDFPDPAKGIKPLKKERTKISPLTLDEVKLFLSTIRLDFKTYFIVRFFTGLRSSEINGLIWDDIELDKNTLWIRRALVDGEVISTKTEGSYRMVQLNSLVVQALRQHKADSKFSHSDDNVFANADGSYLSNDYVGKYIWHPVLRLLNLKPRAMYQTRHTAASIWLASGESPEWISRQLGHTSTEMLFRTYSRYVPNMTKTDGVLVDQYLQNAGITEIYNEE
jgi:integrase